jgi:SAM-dependent methyltransferase
MHSSQEQIFATFESNRWFTRNREALGRFDPAADLPLKLVETYRLRPRSVLEVGAANGVRLAAISQHYNARVVAVEPSVEAILDGQVSFPGVGFVQGQACAIPLQKTSFDLIIVNFVFHWIDRSNLLRSVAEIDRLLVDGGFLIIGDFYPANLTKVRYHHLTQPELYTYKQNYAAIFLASGLYHPVGLITANDCAKAPAGEVPEDDRTGVWLLQKMLKEHYIGRAPMQAAETQGGGPPQKKKIHCPECGAAENYLDGLFVKDLTTPEDENEGLKRFALRCESCGFATSFIGAGGRPLEN